MGGGQAVDVTSAEVASKAGVRGICGGVPSAARSSIERSPCRKRQQTRRIDGDPSLPNCVTSQKKGQAPPLGIHWTKLVNSARSSLGEECNKNTSRSRISLSRKSGSSYSLRCWLFIQSPAFMDTASFSEKRAQFRKFIARDC
ncbi:hypothetical protein Y032_0371g118 [Ancylostoma ceylanicum]|uniref:Uncharacterized protein n=1 Tax=Ancylostoma ceylanicum TaxID=53326 RepID=A0A016RU90_9BILA|nr:hypothetical protein Y032_0371g118 [Ancylostoma ceylanicum]